ncbi:glycosyl transferase [Paenibacillus sp. S-38]|uniref:glycosyl transferase n=1 Tax=Paenibacillus sp. S-38 TaxID=3416710 RepID=UPI003CF08C69
MQEPWVSFAHLERMTDDTALLEHALGRTPRRREGYTTDDNARALWACVEWLEAEARPEHASVLRRLADRYLSFLLWAQRGDGLFHNNFSYDRRPEPEVPSDDCLGRAVWALAQVCSRLPQADLRLPAGEMLLQAAEHIPRMTALRGWAYALSACCLLEHSPAWREQAPLYGPLSADGLGSLIRELEARLLDAFRKASDERWVWFEPQLTYGNGLLPWALLRSYSVTGNPEALDAARRTLDFLTERMTAPQGWIRPVGNRGWCDRTSQALWDQQPLEVLKLSLASLEAYRLLREPAYLETAKRCRLWFHGENDGRVPLADPLDGSCCDGLTPEGPNANRGAESTLAYLLTEALLAASGREEVSAVGTHLAVISDRAFLEVPTQPDSPAPGLHMGS